MGFELRTNIFASVKITAPSGGYAAGDMIKVEDKVGVIVEAALVTKDAVLVYSAEKVVVPKTAYTGVIFAIGDMVYYDSSAAAVTNVSTGNTLCGRALEAAGATATTVLIDLKGNVAA